VLALLGALLIGKAALLVLLCLLFRETLAVALRIALLLAQGASSRSSCSARRGPAAFSSRTPFRFWWLRLRSAWR
jgi:hypothetical protein